MQASRQHVYKVMTGFEWGVSFRGSLPILRSMESQTLQTPDKKEVIAKIKELRARSGAPMGDVKSALEEVNYDMEKALEALRKRGVAAAAKKASRPAAQVYPLSKKLGQFRNNFYAIYQTYLRLHIKSRMFCIGKDYTPRVQLYTLVLRRCRLTVNGTRMSLISRNWSYMLRCQPLVAAIGAESGPQSVGRGEMMCMFSDS